MTVTVVSDVAGVGPVAAQGPGAPRAGVAEELGVRSRWPASGWLWGAAIAFHHLGEWSYWLPMVALLAGGLACAWPGRAAFGPGPGTRPAEAGSTGGEPSDAGPSATNGTGTLQRG
jgi:hypothetical protein